MATTAASSEMFHVNGVDLAWSERGISPPGVPTLVLCHGYTGSALDFSLVADALAVDRRVVTLDQRGHGHSTKTGHLEGYTIEQLSADLAALLQRQRFNVAHRHAVLEKHSGMIRAQRQTPLPSDTEKVNINAASQVCMIDVLLIGMLESVQFTVARRGSVHPAPAKPKLQLPLPGPATCRRRSTSPPNPPRTARGAARCWRHCRS